MPEMSRNLIPQIVHQYQPVMRLGDSFDYHPIRRASPYEDALAHHATCCDRRISQASFQRMVDLTLMSLHLHVEDPDVLRVDVGRLEAAGKGYVFNPGTIRQTAEHVSILELGLVQGIDYQPVGDGGVMVIDIMPSVDVCPFSASIQEYVTLDVLRLSNTREFQGLDTAFSGVVVNLYLDPSNEPWFKGRANIEYQSKHDKPGFGAVAEQWIRSSPEVMSRVEKLRDASLIGSAQDCGIDSWDQDRDPSPLAAVSHKYWVWERANEHSKTVDLGRRQVNG